MSEHDDRTHAWRLSSVPGYDAVAMDPITITRYMPGYGARHARFNQGQTNRLQVMPWKAAILYLPGGVEACRLP